MSMRRSTGTVGDMQTKIRSEEGIFSRYRGIEIPCYRFAQRKFHNFVFCDLVAKTEIN